MSSFIGNQPATSFETVRKQVSTSNSGTTITLDYPVTSVADIRLTINAVVQSYDNYSVSGSTLTVGGTLNNDRVEILFVGRTYGSIAPSDASIVTSSLQDDAVTAAKLSSTAVDNTNTNSTLITAQTEKSSLVDADKFLISDSAASGALKYVQKSNLPSGTHILLNSGTFSSASNLTFNNTLITSTYNKYVVEFINCKLQNDTYLSLYGSTDNGSSYGTSNAYQITGAIFEATQSSNSLFTRNNNSSADMTLIGNAQTVDNAYVFGLRVEIYNPTSTNQQKGVLFKGFYTHTSGDLAVVYGGGAFREGGNGAGTTAVNNIKFEPSNGNIASGIYRLYGVT